MIDFATLERPGTPNTALYADYGDTMSEADANALQFNAPPAVVIAAWDRVVRWADRTTVKTFDVERGLHHAVVRSRVFRFPDDVYAKAVPHGEGGTRLMLYSAARIGRGDFNVNANRLKEWSSKLRREVG